MCVCWKGAGGEIKIVNGWIPNIWIYPKMEIFYKLQKKKKKRKI